jgi:hypothetical protein
MEQHLKFLRFMLMDAILVINQTATFLVWNALIRFPAVPENIAAGFLWFQSMIKGDYGIDDISKVWLVLNVHPGGPCVTRCWPGSSKS